MGSTLLAKEDVAGEGRDVGETRHGHALRAGAGVDAGRERLDRLVLAADVDVGDVGVLLEDDGHDGLGVGVLGAEEMGEDVTVREDLIQAESLLGGGTVGAGGLGGFAGILGSHGGYFLV